MNRLDVLLDIISSEVNDSEDMAIDQIVQTILVALAVWRLQKEMPKYELSRMVDKALSRFRHNAVTQFEKTKNEVIDEDEFQQQLEKNLGKARWRLREILDGI
jgi:hypothetical protein